MKNKKQTKEDSSSWQVIKLTEPIESEFKPEKSYYKIFDRYGLMMGRMISGSKSMYHERFPDHEVYFNANIVLESNGKVWYGDIDFTLDKSKLQEIANVLGEPLYVLSEIRRRTVTNH